MKRCICFSLLVILILILPSCAKSSYRDDILCSKISTELYDEADIISEYSVYSREDIDFLFNGTSLYDDLSVLYSTDVNDISEIGVFHCSDEEKASELLSVVEKYISDMQKNQKAFIASYAPREVQKLERAEARRYGNYVIYTILDDNSHSEAFEEARELLQK